MSAIAERFAELKSRGQTAVMPFLTAGDPDLEFTGELLRRLDVLQPGLFEIGFPYSDPIADGPVIQASYTRALGGGVRIDAIFRKVGDLSPTLTQPLVAMVSYAIILRYGMDRFLETARDSGFAGLIVPDFWWNPQDPLLDGCRRAGLDWIPLITPTTPVQRLAAIAQQATGFIYYVSVAGVTGERKVLPDELAEKLAALRAASPVPVGVGFGIGDPQQVQELRPHCDGAIVGSAIIRRLAALSESPPAQRSQVLDDIQAFVQTLIDAARDQTADPALSNPHH